MLKKILFLFVFSVGLFSYNNLFATCSKSSITKCLDSACAINIGLNPSARCQLCGSENSGEFTIEEGLENVSLGMSSKNTLSAKELKKAPKSPNKRYIWATEQCIKKNPDCTPDDVTNTYDDLIKQSCKAAGIDMAMNAIQKEMGKQKSKVICETEIKNCVIKENHCSVDWSGCLEDDSFSRFFSECVASVSKCDDYISDLRTKFLDDRDVFVKNKEKVLNDLIAGYKNKRENSLKEIKNSCKDNSKFDSCVSNVCSINMTNSCKAGFEYEKAIAANLCKYLKIACDKLKR